MPAIASGGFAPFLIHGVTGSGKTEVYLAAIEEVVARGREAIVLVPEISLTPQTIRRFRRRFARVAVLHSHLSDAERHRHWQSIASGEVAGRRRRPIGGLRPGAPAGSDRHRRRAREHLQAGDDSAVPRARRGRQARADGRNPGASGLGHAVARKLAQRRARAVHPAGDAEPGRRPADAGRRDHRPAEREDRRGRPERVAPPGDGQALDDGGQVILLLNRRGFHTFVLCPRCGHVVKCHACDVAATYHKSRHILICHTCDAERAVPAGLPGCGAQALHYGGIGTERLEREIRAAFPDVVARRMDSDTMRSPGSHEQVLSAFKAGDVRILLGTQMIAKGLDFPNVTWWAWSTPTRRFTCRISAPPSGPSSSWRRWPDARAEAIGPAACSCRPMRPTIPRSASAATHDYEGFARSELPEREKYGVPPYGRIVRLIARGPEEAAVSAYMNDLAAAFRAAADPSVRILGPAPAPIIKIRNLYRFHLQLRCPHSRPLQLLANTVPGQHPAPHGIELAIDVDPITML